MPARRTPSRPNDGTKDQSLVVKTYACSLIFANIRNKIYFTKRLRIFLIKDHETALRHVENNALTIKLLQQSL